MERQGRVGPGAHASGGLAATREAREVGVRGDLRRPTWAEIDLYALRANLERARAAARGKRLIAVVKADAYGHGAVAVSRELARAGAHALAVATLDEALEIRAARVELPILLLEGLHRATDADVAVSERLTPAIGRIEQIAPLDAAARRAGLEFSVHVNFDTGMGRLGFAAADIEAVLDQMAAASNLSFGGLMTHLAESDDPASPQTPAQRRRFADLLARVRARGFAPEWIHVDPSAALLHGATDFATAVRPGLMLYGADPTLDRCADLRPVLSLRTRVMHAKDVAAGTRIGYGGAFVAPSATRIATLPVGYADGLPRSAGGRVSVVLDGRRVPVVGRVSMDLATVDVGPHASSDVGAEVVVFGFGGPPVEEIAEALGLLSYELLTGIGPRVPRTLRGTSVG